MQIPYNIYGKKLPGAILFIITEHTIVRIIKNTIDIGMI